MTIKNKDRIQARAIRRCGELLKQVEASKGGQPTHKSTQEGALLSIPTRESVAKDAGLSEWQRKTALRVANVPPPTFEEAVESDSPPTVTQLAKQGRQRKPEPLFDLGGNRGMTSTMCAQDCAHVPDWNPENQATARLCACSLASVLK